MHCDLAQAREAITAHQIDRHVPDLLVVEGQLAAADGDVAVWAGPQCPEIAVLKWALVFGLGLLVLTFQTPDGNCSSARRTTPRPRSGPTAASPDTQLYRTCPTLRIPRMVWGPLSPTDSK